MSIILCCAFLASYISSFVIPRLWVGHLCEPFAYSSRTFWTSALDVFSMLKYLSQSAFSFSTSSLDMRSFCDLGHIFWFDLWVVFPRTLPYSSHIFWGAFVSEMLFESFLDLFLVFLLCLYIYSKVQNLWPAPK